MFLKKCRTQSHDSRNKTRLKICLFTLLAIFATAATVCVYYAVAHPIVSKHFSTSQVHEDISYYKDNTYLTFESGKRFCEFVSKSEITATAEPFYFYHIDNKKRDNPIYGKACDVFAVDFSVSEDQFLEEKLRIIGDIDEQLWCENGFTFYVVEDKTNINGDILMIAFAENTIIRYILITDLEPYPYDDTSQYAQGLYYAHVLYHNSNVRREAVHIA